MAETEKIFVGFRTQLAPTAVIEALRPSAFKANARLKDKVKIEADQRAKEEAFFAAAKDQPYTGQFAAVALLVPRSQKPELFLAEHHGPKSVKGPLCLAVREYLLSYCPVAWSWETHDRSPAKALFVGFNPRLFLKMLGEECSLPQHANPLPLQMWYASDFIDIEEAVVPNKFPSLTLEMAVRARRPIEPDAAAKWDERYLANWQPPHQDPGRDVYLAIELATQLGIVGNPRSEG